MVDATVGVTWIHAEADGTHLPIHVTVEFGLEDDRISNLAKAEVDNAALNSQLVSGQGQ